MKVMVIVKASKESESGGPRDKAKLAKMFEEMGAFNDELIKAGILLAADGLTPSSKGKRVKLAGGTREVIDGPFTETKELVAGFWIWQVRSIEEAVEWARRCPDPHPGEEAELEIRPIGDISDFDLELTPELRAQEERFRAEVERQSQSQKA